jgi:hypothetical protein
MDELPREIFELLLGPPLRTPTSTPRSEQIQQKRRGNTDLGLQIWRLHCELIDRGREGTSPHL